MSAEGLDEEINGITHRIIGCAIEVHRELGPGLLESCYQRALALELELSGLHFQPERKIPLFYKGREIGEYFADFMVEDQVIVETKSVSALEPIFEAQLLTYLKLTKRRLGLLINFNEKWLKDGLRRMIL